MSSPEYSHKREQEDHYHQYPSKDSYEILADNSSEYIKNLSETHENDMFDKPMGGPDLLTDELIEEVLAREPRKFTLHCVFFLMAIIALFFICKWVSIRFIESKAKDSQFDIMMKR